MASHRSEKWCNASRARWSCSRRSAWRSSRSAPISWICELTRTRSSVIALSRHREDEQEAIRQQDGCHDAQDERAKKNEAGRRYDGHRAQNDPDLVDRGRVNEVGILGQRMVALMLIVLGPGLELLLPLALERVARISRIGLVVVPGHGLSVGIDPALEPLTRGFGQC